MKCLLLLTLTYALVFALPAWAGEQSAEVQPAAERAAGRLADAEKRFAAAVEALKAADPQLRRTITKVEPMSPLGKAWCNGVVNDSKLPAGSIEARTVLTNCWASSINENAASVEGAAREAASRAGNTPLRPTSD